LPKNYTYFAYTGIILYLHRKTTKKTKQFMKKLIALALLAGITFANVSFAQDVKSAKAEKKESKSEKKEDKGKMKQSDKKDTKMEKKEAKGK
jgi:high-affinity K+ transport system ATPase subunit B